MHKQSFLSYQASVRFCPSAKYNIMKFKFPLFLFIQLTLSPCFTNGLQQPMTMYASSPASTSSSIGSSSSYMFSSRIPQSTRILQQEQSLLETRTHALLSTPSPLPPEFYSEAKHVMYAWAKNPHIQKYYPDEPAKCALTIETFLKRMIDEQQFFPRKDQLQAKVEFSSPNAFLSIIDELESMVTEKDVKMGVNVYMYNALILAWAESGIGDAAFERCSQILKFMHSLSSEQAQILELLGDEDEDSEFQDIKPNLNTVRNTLYAATSATTNPGLKAELIMEYVTNEGILKPNVDCWNIVLFAWSQCAGTAVGSAQRAQQILNWMIASSSQHDPSDEHSDKAAINRNLQPNIQTFRNVVRAWEKSEDLDGGDRAEEIAWLGYRRFPQIWDMPTWISVIKAYARRGDAAKAHAILIECRRHVGKEGDIPNLCYALVLNAYARSPDKSVAAAVAAEELLTEMMELDQATNSQIRPNTFCFNIVMQAWSRSRAKGAAKRVELIFNRMQRLHKRELKRESIIPSGIGECNKYTYRPNAITYHILIKSWSWVRGHQAALRAEKYLDQMEDMYFNQNLVHMKPNIRTYTLVMNAWSRCSIGEEVNGALRAQSILERLEKMYFEGSISCLKPDRQCYASVLNAWSRSREPNKAFMACELLNRMEHLYQTGAEDLKPDIGLHNTVMNTAAFTPYEESIPQQQREALDITYQTFKNLEKNSGEYGIPDSIIYSTFLKACRKLMPADETRNSVVKAVFEKCCREGHVSGVVVRELKRCCGQDVLGIRLWDELILKKNINDDTEDTGGYPSLKNLPTGWSRNVSKHRGHEKGRRY